MTQVMQENFYFHYEPYSVYLLTIYARSKTILKYLKTSEHKMRRVKSTKETITAFDSWNGK